MNPIRWLLDTNIISKAIRNEGAARERLMAHQRQRLAVSSVSIAELEYGALKAPEPERYRTRWRTFIAGLAVLDFDHDAAVAHARLRLATRHAPIGERDLLIAAIAATRRLVVVTNNREFLRVPDVPVEDWS